MTGWMPLTPRDDEGGEPLITVVDPTREMETARARWTLRAAEWRAVALARSVFGGPVAPRLAGPSSGPGGFRGLLHLEVPFSDPELHLWRERVFTACAARDPVLAQVPLVYVFAPRVRRRDDEADEGDQADQGAAAEHGGAVEEGAASEVGAPGDGTAER